MLNKSFIVLLTIIFSIIAIAFTEEANSEGFKNRVRIKTIENRYHHLGDDYMDDFIVPDPEETYWEKSFWLPNRFFKHKEIVFVKFNARHVDVTYLIVNGNRRRLQDINQTDTPVSLLWTYAIPVPLDNFQIGENTIGFEVHLYHDGNWDDMEFGELKIWFQ